MHMDFSAHYVSEIAQYLSYTHDRGGDVCVHPQRRQSVDLQTTYID